MNLQGLFFFFFPLLAKASLQVISFQLFAPQLFHACPCCHQTCCSPHPVSLDNPRCADTGTKGPHGPRGAAPSASSKASRVLFEPCRGDGGRCKPPCVLSLRYIPPCTQHHPPHPTTAPTSSRHSTHLLSRARWAGSKSHNFAAFRLN